MRGFVILVVAAVLFVMSGVTMELLRLTGAYIFIVIGAIFGIRAILVGRRLNS
jgi:hypothetical protein